MSGRILIADQTSTHRISLRSLLASAHYDLVCAESPDEAMSALDETGADLVILDEAIALDPALPVLERIRTDPKTARLPVIVITDDHGREDRLRSLRAGADDVISRSASKAGLLARLRSQLRAADTTEALGRRQATVRDLGFAEPHKGFEAPSRIALIAHDCGRAECWRGLLKPQVRHPLAAMGMQDALGESSRSMAADLFVIEAALAHPGEALGLIADLRARSKTRHAAILVVHEAGDTSTATMALDMGASDLIEAGFLPEELVLRLENQLRRKRAADRLRDSVDEGLRLAVLDPLTGLFNRRYAMAHADRVIRNKGTTEAYCVILADIDRFKQINDTYGHRAGDAVLSAVAAQLRENVRGMDMVARIGGEEFLVFMPDPDALKAEAAAIRLRDMLHDAVIDLPGVSTPVSVTASFGVARSAPGEALEEVIERADRALYQAKTSGRDRVTLDASAAA